MRRTLGIAAAIAGLLLGTPGQIRARTAGLTGLPCAGWLEDEGAPAYYRIELINTHRVSGNGRAQGAGEVRFAPSPFGLQLSADGEYVRELNVHLAEVRPVAGYVPVVWVATQELDRVRRFAVLDRSLQASGLVQWNKFLVIVSLERSGQIGTRWQGPILLRGMSRSGRMHAMAGHGPFQGEPCAKYGY